MSGLKRLIAVLILVTMPMVALASEENTWKIPPLVEPEVHILDLILSPKPTPVTISFDTSEASPEVNPEREAAVLLERAKVENDRRVSMRAAELTNTECLALAMYHEARGEGDRGMIAVAFVIYNRVQSGKYPNDFCQVVLQRRQFSFTEDHHPDNINDWTSYEKILAMAVYLLENGGFQRDRSPVGQAMFFHANYVRPRWAKAQRFIATIGNHRFFR